MTWSDDMSAFERRFAEKKELEATYKNTAMDDLRQRMHIAPEKGNRQQRRAAAARLRKK